MAGLFKISVLTALAASITSVVATPPACLLACAAQVQKQLDCLGLNDLKCICSLEQLAIKSCLDKLCPSGDADAAKKQLGSTCNGIDESSSSSLALQSSLASSSQSSLASASALPSKELSSAEPTSASAEPTSASGEGSADGSASAEPTLASGEGSGHGSPQSSVEPTSASVEESAQGSQGSQGGVVTESIPCEQCHQSSHQAVPTTQQTQQSAAEQSGNGVAPVPTVSQGNNAEKVGAAGAAMVIAGLALL